MRETKQPVSQSAQRLFAHRFEPAIAIECFGTRVDVDDRELDRTFALLACKFQDAVQLTGSDALAATVQVKSGQSRQVAAEAGYDGAVKVQTWANDARATFCIPEYRLELARERRAIKQTCGMALIVAQT